MKQKIFNKLVKEHKNNLQEIINMYCMNKIYLTNKQLDKINTLRGERKYPHYKLIGNRSVIVK